MIVIWEFHYPYLTDKGKSLFYVLKKQLLEIVAQEMTTTTT